MSPYTVPHTIRPLRQLGCTAKLLPSRIACHAGVFTELHDMTSLLKGRKKQTNKQTNKPYMGAFSTINQSIKQVKFHLVDHYQDVGDVRLLRHFLEYVITLRGRVPELLPVGGGGGTRLHSQLLRTEQIRTPVVHLSQHVHLGRSAVCSNAASGRSVCHFLPPDVAYMIGFFITPEFTWLPLLERKKMITHKKEVLFNHILNYCAIHR